MRPVVIIISLAISFSIFAQDAEITAPDSLAVKSLDYEVVDAAHARQLNKYINIDTCSFFASSEGAKIAYSIHDKNKWTVVSLGNSDEINTVNEIKRIAGTRKGESALIVQGSQSSYGTGGGGGMNWMVILTMDTAPRQVLNIDYGCWEESFGDRSHNGEDRYNNEYKREITIFKNGISIAAMSKEDNYIYDCRLTNIAAGNYILRNGRMVKSK